MSNPSASNEFLELFTGSQLRLYRYIVVLVANQVEAEDILQNTNLVMLQKCDQFQPGTNFVAWSAGIAYLEVLKYRTSRKRASHGLSDATLEMLAAEALARTRCWSTAMRFCRAVWKGFRPPICAGDRPLFPRLVVGGDRPDVGSNIEFGASFDLPDSPRVEAVH